MELISDYCGDSNKIDAHNQARQYELKLEKHWIMQDGFFRIVITVLGMVITDCWNAVRHYTSNEDPKNMAIVDYSDRLAWDLIHNEESATERAAFLEPDTSSLPSHVTLEHSAAAASTISPLSIGTRSVNSSIESHVLIKNPDLDPKEGRPQRRRCAKCSTRTMWLCNHPVCRSTTKTYGANEYEGLFLCANGKCFQTHILK